ncbi:hypothetical protein F0562_013251 [Nyssa sinensis]|uniref:Tubby C-terminal domain-containing protein n=1 Tax=Nyssa sinensis TaxID=561372 RepID=A0A5J4ZXF9_9ASTE|nr:hypothetical protein F0562_013251 [Nyssa sinensis]
MTKVYPHTPTCSSYMTSTRETFTIWMKSLVFHGNGCTVFDSNGEIVYRIDNYGRKCSGSEVYLMDLRGKVLFSIQPKKLQVFGCWDGYKWSDSAVNKESPWFQVRKDLNILRKDMSCSVTLGCGKSKASCYKMVGLAGKSAFKIIDTDDRIIAEVKQKQSSSGVSLGDDVLTLTVEPQIDHSLITALVTVYGLMNHKM